MNIREWDKAAFDETWQEHAYAHLIVNLEKEVSLFLESHNRTIPIYKLFILNGDTQEIDEDDWIDLYKDMASEACNHASSILGIDYIPYEEDTLWEMAIWAEEETKGLLGEKTQ